MILSGKSLFPIVGGAGKSPSPGQVPSLFTLLIGDGDILCDRQSDDGEGGTVIVCLELIGDAGGGGCLITFAGG